MNIYDIAREAGVSITTVSRVLNGREGVSPRTRARVEAVLARNHYAPSAIARGMVSNSLRTVAVLTVDVRVPHYARTAYTIERELSRRGYDVTLCNTGGVLKEAVRYLRVVTEKKVDGIVLVGSVFNRIGKDAEVLGLLRGVPVVLANGLLELPGSYSVLVNDAHGVALAVDHVFDRGKRAPVYLKDRDTASAAAKRDGFLDALARHGVKDPARRVVETGERLEDAVQAVEKLLAANTAFDAVVCGEDLTAAGALKALLRAGLRVPQDVAVTGFNNSEYARVCEPALTTVDNKPELVAMLSVQLLESLIEKTGAYSSVTIQPELVRGGTT